MPQPTPLGPPAPYGGPLVVQLPLLTRPAKLDAVRLARAHAVLTLSPRHRPKRTAGQAKTLRGHC